MTGDTDPEKIIPNSQHCKRPNWNSDRNTVIHDSLVTNNPKGCTKLFDYEDVRLSATYEQGLANEMFS
jgi:hypothetical protein